MPSSRLSPDIIGKAKDIHVGAIPGGEQCFTWTKNGELTAAALNGDWGFGYFSFNASKSNAMFGKATTNQPSALRLLAIVKY